MDQLKLIRNQMSLKMGNKISHSLHNIFDHLNDNNFKNIEIISLEEFSEIKKISYDRLRGYNNLLFFATKH